MHRCISLGLTVGLGKAKLRAGHNTCTKVLQNQDVASSYSSGLHQHYTEVVGGTGWGGAVALTHNNSLGYRNWLKTLKDVPGVVGYSLRPLHELLSDWRQKLALKAAIEQYLKDNAIRRSTRQPYCRSYPNLDFRCCPERAWRGTLVVTIVRAWRLKGDFWGKTEGYVENKSKYRERAG